MIDGEVTCDNLKAWGTNIDIRPYSYSGRGMYGKRCVAFTVEQYGEINSPFSLIHALTKEALNEAMDEHEGDDYQSIVNDTLDAMDSMVRGARTDNMGHDTVVYFTTVEWTEDEESSFDTET